MAYRLIRNDFCVDCVDHRRSGPYVSGMSNAKRCEVTTFLPSEVAAISGVNVGLQRTWRHQGHLESMSSGRWTRHTLLQTAALLVQGELFRRGIPPRVSRNCARAAAPQILIWAHRYSGVRGGRKYPKAGTTKPKGQLKRFLVQWGPRQKNYAFATSLDAFYRVKSRQNLSAAIIIDLRRMAEHLVTAAGRSLARVKEPD